MDRHKIAKEESKRAIKEDIQKQAVGRIARDKAKVIAQNARQQAEQEFMEGANGALESISHGIAIAMAGLISPMIQDAVMKYLAKLEDRMLNIYRAHVANSFADVVGEMTAERIMSIINEAGMTLGQDEQLAEDIWARIEDDITSRLGEIGENDPSVDWHDHTLDHTLDKKG